MTDRIALADRIPRPGIRHAPPQTRLADLIRRGEELVRLASRALWPGTDLILRLTLAQAFLVSGLVKLGNWDHALLLARDEYPVPWLDPTTAAATGLAIELIAPVLLILGLATRLAALPLLLLTLVAQQTYLALDVHLLWAGLLGWYLVHGAGPRSLDRLLAKGLADSAVPLAGAALAVGRLLESRAAPLFDLGLRLWLATGLAAGSGVVTLAGGHWLPTQTLGAFAPWLAVGASVLLVLGLGVRWTALTLLLAALGLGMDGVQMERLAWLVLLLLPLALNGGGVLGVDGLLPGLLRSRVPGLAPPDAAALDALPRVIIVGAGFGGIACARALRHAPLSVTLVDRHNYHLFQPLLYQVATSGLAPSDIATPVRELFREQRNARVLLGTVVGVDPERRRVTLERGSLEYDYLVLATGAGHGYFGRDDWAPFAPGLKHIEDATEVRRRLLLAFERAEASDDPAERDALMTFLIVGGGPTGVELAGAIAELARFGMDADYRRIDPRDARVILVQSGPRILPSFPEALSARAADSLRALGVEVLTDSRVTDIDAEGVAIGDRRIAARTLLWAAGVVASPAARWIGAAAADGAGRIQVGEDLTVPGRPEIFAIGDTALAADRQGRPVPGLAPAAKQGGAYVAAVIAARVRGRPAPGPFVYRHRGNLATVGRKAAVVDLGSIRLSGAPAWWLWGLVHVAFLVGVRNRVAVMWNWFWAYLTYRGGTRLITGGPDVPAHGATDPLVGAATRAGAAEILRSRSRSGSAVAPALERGVS